MDVVETGTQVTLLCRSLFAKYLEGTGVTRADEIPLADAPCCQFLSCDLVNCMVGRIPVSGKVVIIVNDECLGPTEGIMGLKMIQAVWSGLSAFKTTLTHL